MYLSIYLYIKYVFVYKYMGILSKALKSSYCLPENQKMFREKAKL